MDVRINSDRETNDRNILSRFYKLHRYIKQIDKLNRYTKRRYNETRDHKGLNESSTYTNRRQQRMSGNVENKSILTEEVSTVEVVEGVTITPVMKKEYRETEDGKIPWRYILERIRGRRVTVYQLYISIQKTYGEESISRMRVYKWLNSLVREKIATKEEYSEGDYYTIKEK